MKDNKLHDKIFALADKAISFHIYKDFFIAKLEEIPIGNNKFGYKVMEFSLRDGNISELSLSASYSYNPYTTDEEISKGEFVGRFINGLIK